MDSLRATWTHRAQRSLAAGGSYGSQLDLNEHTSFLEIVVVRFIIVCPRLCHMEADTVVLREHTFKTMHSA